MTKSEQRVVLVAGAASEIGRASTLVFLAQGALVAAVDVNGGGRAELAGTVLTVDRSYQAR